MSAPSPDEARRRLPSGEGGSRRAVSPAGASTWLLALGVWTLLALLEAAKSWVTMGQLGRPRVWWWVILATFPWWYGWALLTPVAFRLAARWPVAGPERGRSIAVHAAAAILLSAAHSIITGYATHWLTRGRAMPSAGRQISVFLTNYFIVDLVIYGAIVGAWFALDYARRWRESTMAAAQSEARAAQLELGLADARLQALRMELNPHFLFNTLNAIAGLVRRREHDAAVGMIARLGDLLRATLDRDLPQEIALEEEVALLQRYLDIERARFGGRLTIALDVSPDAARALVPTLVLQPLVENAIRHGVAHRSGAVSVRVCAERRADALVLEVHDTGRGLATAPIEEGIGLANTRARLRTLHGAAALLTLQDAPGGGAVAVARLPYREAPLESFAELHVPVGE